MGKSENEMDDDWGYPFFRTPPFDEMLMIFMGRSASKWEEEPTWFAGRTTKYDEIGPEAGFRAHCERNFICSFFTYRSSSILAQFSLHKLSTIHMVVS